MAIARPNTSGAATATNPTALRHRFLRLSNMSRSFCKSETSYINLRPVLISRRPFYVVDHDYFNGAFSCFQFQAELLLNGCEKRRIITIRQNRGWGCLKLIRRELQLEIIIARKCGLI